MNRFAALTAWALVCVAVALSLASCSVEDLLAEPRCDDVDTLLLVAQSVPTARLVPCFEALPVGWSTAEVVIDDTGTTITFDSDRAGEGGAAFNYAQDCDLNNTTETPTTSAGVRRFDALDRRNQRQTTVLTFRGGCVTWGLATANVGARTATDALTSRVRLIERQRLEDIGNPRAAADRRRHGRR